MLHCLFSYLKWFQNYSIFLIDCKISIGKHCIKILCYCWSLFKLFTTFATCICVLHVHVHPKHTTIQKYRSFLLIQGENMLYEKFKTPFSKVLILAKNWISWKTFRFLIWKHDFDTFICRSFTPWKMKNVFWLVEKNIYQQWDFIR